MFGRVWGLNPVVQIYPKTGLLVPVAGSHKLEIVVEMVAHGGYVVTAIADFALSAAIYERRV